MCLIREVKIASLLGLKNASIPADYRTESH